MLWPQLQTGRPEHPPPLFSCPLLCKWFSRLPWPPALSPLMGSNNFTHTVGHSPRAKGKHGWKVEGRPAALCHTSPGEVSAGHSPGGLSRLSTICLLPLKNLLLSTETCVHSSRHSVSGLDCDLVGFFLTTMFQSFYILISLVFIHWSAAHLLWVPLKSHCDPPHYDYSSDTDLCGMRDL